MVNWINHRFGINLDENDLVSIKDFSLIWNIFENSVCNNHYSVQQVGQTIASRLFNIADFQPQLDYFKNRYVANGATNTRFDNLHFRANDRKESVRQVLLEQVNTVPEIILALMIIVGRFRNNLFHGIKDIQVIDQQKTNFDNANAFLKALLSYI
jgi:hypothetical protein